MPASRASSEASSSMLYVLVIFVVLFLAAAVFAVVLFVNNEDLRKDAESARTELKKFGKDSELREVKPLVKKGKTVLGQLSADMKYLCGLIAGQDLPNFSLVGAKGMVDGRLEPLWDQVSQSLSNPEEADPTLGLKSILESLISENNTLMNLYLQAEQDKASQEQLAGQTISDLQSQLDQMRNDLDAASSSAQTIETTYSERMEDQSSRYENIIQGYEDEKAQMQGDMDQMQKELKAMRKEQDKYNAKMREMEDILQQIRPSPEMDIEALKVDGSVISVNSRDKLAYINLAKNDHIYRGLTFSVYDSYQPIPKGGKGKGTLEVIEILDSISKCRITDFDPTNPIMKSDIIANLIWDKDKKYQFCVAGDFDINDDGQVDPDGREEIVSLIHGWGGEVSDILSIDTDFLVLGRPPVIPTRPMDEDLDRNTRKAIEWRRANEMADQYKQVRQDGASLGVPTFNTSRFFSFIGYHQTKK